uniref:Uncharacterized protein n=1 Tax=Anguilla anguilla TaxID=7936 RepID=A0A0E9VAB1_ANGAN
MCTLHMFSVYMFLDMCFWTCDFS